MDENKAPAPAPETPPAAPNAETTPPAPPPQPPEVGGRKGPDPTRYGDWEVGGIAVDF